MTGKKLTSDRESDSSSNVSSNISTIIHAMTVYLDSVSYYDYVVWCVITVMPSHFITWFNLHSHFVHKLHRLHWYLYVIRKNFNVFRNVNAKKKHLHLLIIKHYKNTGSVYWRKRTINSSVNGRVGAQINWNDRNCLCTESFWHRYELKRILSALIILILTSNNAFYMLSWSIVRLEFSQSREKWWAVWQ